jgi:uroporphyrinogen decarboxylase
MKKREFLKSSLYVVGGLGLASAGAVSLHTSPKFLADKGNKVNYLHQAKVNKREKTLAVLDQSKPNPYVPAAFFMHFKEKFGQGAVDRHIEYFRATNMDFVKVQYEIVVPRLDHIKKPEDWEKIPVYGKDFFEPQLAVIEALAKELKAEALIIPTVYSPFTLAGQTVGRNLLPHAQENPEAVAKGFRNITESILNYIREAIRRGADGFYISTQGGDMNNFGETPLYDKLVQPFDQIVSQEASDKALVNILHICDYESSYRQIRKFASYPGSIINPPVRLADGSAIQTKEVQQAFGRPVMGGLNRLGILAKGSPEEIKPEVDRIFKAAAPNFILAADCTVPGEVPWPTLRAVIDYAHEWRGMFGEA